MNLLLVNPYITDFTAYDLWLRPLGLLYLAAVAARYSDARIYWLDTLDRALLPPGTGDKPDGRGHYHRIILQKPGIYRPVPRRYARYGLPLPVFGERLNRLPEMDLILITSLMTYWIDGLEFTLRKLKERFPRTPVVLGGIIANLVPSRILHQQLAVDYVIRGYGESRILPLMARHGARIRSHPDLSDIRKLPLPAVHHLGNPKTLPLLTSRGCPLRCTYCASPVLNRRFLQRPAGDLIDEIRLHHGKFGTRDFVFYDDALLIDKERRIAPLLQAVIGEKLPVRFHTPNGIHTRRIDAATARLLRASGFVTLNLSFESTAPDTLHRSCGKVDQRDMERAVRCLVDAGYRPGDIGCYLLFGAPWQTRRELDRSLDLAEKLNIKPNLAYYSPVPRTPDYRQLVRDGCLNAFNLHETNKIYFLYQKSPFSTPDIRAIKNRASRIRSRLAPSAPRVIRSQG